MPETVTAFAPGRVNLIGEHTDYNRGLALPFAIAEGVTVRARPGDRGRVTVVARDLDGAQDSFALREPPHTPGWRAFARGIASELQAAGIGLSGVELEITGTVPRGSGLSSSAALEVALSLALLAAAGAPEPDRLDLAALCSRVENEWVGAQTGLLDQIASLCGQADRGLRVDFDVPSVEVVPLDLGGYALVTLDSGQRHANAGRGSDRGGSAEPGYNQRRAECARACALLAVETLRVVTLQQAEGLPEPLNRRVRHVITENERVEQTAAALTAGDLDRVGELLNASHSSLRDDYEVSTSAVERTVARLREAGAVGARIVGGGFGGHVLGLLPPGAVAPPGSVSVTPSPGARLIA
ncbi:MAG: galactokinase [Solirubrobacteraceae bacterium]|nr:galactokinase [Solirubrobacteraceae bacterium]